MRLQASEELAKKINQMIPLLNEKQLRRYLGSEAEALGFGGIQVISEISGKSRHTIALGMKENQRNEPDTNRVRRVGGGRKPLKEKYPEIMHELENIVKYSTLDNPDNPLTYTTKSTRKIKQILNEKGYEIGHNVVGNLLEECGYSLQLNQKMLQAGNERPDRSSQFEYINEKAKDFLESGDPVISIDAKKKELVDNFKNNGSTYNKQNNPTKMPVHDFPLKELGKVAPYGVYDINKNEGFVNLGISKDTAEFAVESISRWWLTVGTHTYPETSRLYINCDAWGSDGYKNRLFKLQLQEFANQSNLEVHVSHFPPGTSKWSKIEHRLFCYISSHLRGQPLISIETTVTLVGSTATTSGLKVKCVKDENIYKIGIKVSDEDFDKINVKHEERYSTWNYIIYPMLSI
jgi:hypothetical protein